MIIKMTYEIRQTCSMSLEIPDNAKNAHDDDKTA